MNENIKNLMKSADYAAPEIAVRAQKLVDLIIFECIKIAVFKGDKETAKAIKEQFGVEI